MSVLTGTADQVAQCLAQKTGLDINVVRAWIAIESAWGKSPTDHYNYLNLKSSRGNTFASFNSPADACDAYAQNLQGPDYVGIRASVPGGPVKQLQAITNSPWDEGHYGGNGSTLVRTYNDVQKSYGSSGGLLGLAQGFETGGIPGAIKGLKGKPKGPVKPPGTIHIPGTDTDFPLGLYFMVAAGGFIVLVGLVFVLAAVGLRSGAAEGAVQRLPVAGPAVKSVRRRQGERRTARAERAKTEEQVIRAQARGAAYRGEGGNPLVFSEGEPA